MKYRSLIATKHPIQKTKVDNAKKIVDIVKTGIYNNAKVRINWIHEDDNEAGILYLTGSSKDGMNVVELSEIVLD